MNSLVAFLPAIALLLPALAGDAPDAAPAIDAVREAPESGAPVPLGFDAASEPFRILEEARRPQWPRQVRIEQRIIIRISPSSPDARERLTALSRRSSTNRFEERKIDGCVPIEAIAGVQPAEENRLVLFMRDRRILTAALARSCNARDFYSGFYVERNEDGQICTRRDELQARNGASCRVSQFNRLVAARD